VNVPKGMIYGQSNVPLNPSFEDEAQDVIKNLKGIAFDKIYSSPLSRCLRLSGKITKGTPVQTDNRLLELNFGDWEEKYWKDIDQSEKAQNWFNNYLNEKCPNGESYQDIQQRILSFLDTIQQQKDEHVGIVTHGGPIRVFLSLLENIPQEEIFNRDIAFGQVTHLQLPKSLIKH
jgi:alpha-ribazole phosphatase